MRPWRWIVLLSCSGGGFRLRYICLLAPSLTGRWTKKKPQTNTQTHCRPPRDSSASANKHRTDSQTWLARLMVRLESGASSRLPDAEHKQKKTKDTCAQGVQAARTLSMSSKWQYDIISQSASSSRPAYMRVDANSTQDLTLSLQCSSTALAFQQCVHSSVSDWGNINREPLHLLRQS